VLLNKEVDRTLDSTYDLLSYR